MTKYVVDGRILHGDQELMHGQEIDPEALGISEADVALFRRTGFLKLPEEVMAPEDLAAKSADLEAEIAALRAELEAERAKAKAEAKADPKAKAE